MPQLIGIADADAISSLPLLLLYMICIENNENTGTEIGMFVCLFLLSLLLTSFTIIIVKLSISSSFHRIFIFRVLLKYFVFQIRFRAIPCVYRQKQNANKRKTE